MTSSTSAGSRPVRSMSDCSVRASSPAGCSPASAPFALPLPTGVRTASMITASRMTPPPRVKTRFGNQTHYRGGGWKIQPTELTATIAGRAAGSESEAKPEFVQPGQHVQRVAVDPERAGPLQLLPAVAAGHHPDAEGSGAPCGQQVPDAVAHHQRVPGIDVQPGRRGEEQVRIGFGVSDLV